MLPMTIAGNFHWLGYVHACPSCLSVDESEWCSYIIHVTMLILPRCAANRRRRCSGEPTLSQPFRVQVFFGARWVRQCCLVSWSSWSLKTHFYWRLTVNKFFKPRPSAAYLFFILCSNATIHSQHGRCEKSGFGIIFGGGLSSFLAAAHCHARFPTIEQVKPVQNFVGKFGFLALKHYMGPVILGNYGMLILWEWMVTPVLRDLKHR